MDEQQSCAAHRFSSVYGLSRARVLRWDKCPVAKKEGLGDSASVIGLEHWVDCFDSELINGKLSLMTLGFNLREANPLTPCFLAFKPPTCLRQYPRRSKEMHLGRALLWISKQD